jgi:RNA-directed DNA polymerase
VLCGRIRDGVVKRLIGKWLNAGVLEDGAVTRSEAGSPQGEVVSPVLANIFLHEVLDVWFHRDVSVRLRGRSHLVRYADDAVMLFEYEEDARRVMAVLPERFGKYGLTLHPDKTRMVAFKRPDRMRRGGDDGPDEPGTVDFLGFTIHWAKSPMTGKWVVKMRTAADRFRRTLRSISQWCKRHRHEPLEVQQRGLGLKLRGHYAYYGREGNRARLWSLRQWVAQAWWRWLRRRSQRGLSWEAMTRLLQRYPLQTPTVARPV